LPSKILNFASNSTTSCCRKCCERVRRSWSLRMTTAIWTSCTCRRGVSRWITAVLSNSVQWVDDRGRAESVMASYPQSIDDLAPPPQKRGWRRFLVRHLPGLSFVVLVGVLIVVVLWPYVVITVPSGFVGVLWKRFNGLDMYCWCWVGRGTVLDPRELREEGLHIIWPWDKLYLYNLRLQSTTQTYNAISKDGVNVKAQISVRYQLLHNSV